MKSEGYCPLRIETEFLSRERPFPTFRLSRSFGISGANTTSALYAEPPCSLLKSRNTGGRGRSLTVNRQPTAIFRGVFICQAQERSIILFTASASHLPTARWRWSATTDIGHADNRLPVRRGREYPGRACRRPTRLRPSSVISTRGAATGCGLLPKPNPEVTGRTTTRSRPG